MYTVEILPYSLRAKGFNVFNFVISVALIFNQYVNPIALKAITWRYYVRGWRPSSSLAGVDNLSSDCVLLLDRVRTRIRLHFHHRD